MITASFDIIDCSEATPGDMRVVWVRHADSLSEASSIGWECAGIPYVPSDESTQWYYDNDAEKISNLVSKKLNRLPATLLRVSQTL